MSVGRKSRGAERKEVKARRAEPGPSSKGQTREESTGRSSSGHPTTATAMEEDVSPLDGLCVELGGKMRLLMPRGARQGWRSGRLRTEYY